MKKFTIKLMILAAGFLIILPSCNRKGCTDTAAENYSEKAKKDDGTCIYDTTSTWYTDVTYNGVVYHQLPAHITSNQSLN